MITPGLSGAGDRGLAAAPGASGCRRCRWSCGSGQAGESPPSIRLKSIYYMIKVSTAILIERLR